MKKYLEVIQSNLTQRNRLITHDGIVDYHKNEYIYFTYVEKDSNAKVEVELYQDYATIKRKHEEYTTELNLKVDEVVEGRIISIYGEVKLDVLTNKYIVSDNNIAIEYDVLVSNEVSDSFRIIFKIKEAFS